MFLFTNTLETLLLNIFYKKQKSSKGHVKDQLISLALHLDVSPKSSPHPKNECASFNLVCCGFKEFLENPITCPPAAQAATKPNCPSSRTNLLAVCRHSLTPVAANGCPIESEPPHLFHLARSGAPTLLFLFMQFWANQSESKAFRFASI